jgi:hypothetical protein
MQLNSRNNEPQAAFILFVTDYLSRIQSDHKLRLTVDCGAVFTVVLPPLLPIDSYPAIYTSRSGGVTLIDRREDSELLSIAVYSTELNGAFLIFFLKLDGLSVTCQIVQ